MIKEEVEIVKKTNMSRYCDKCGDHMYGVDTSVFRYPGTFCKMCKIDLCKMHRNEDPTLEEYQRERTEEIYCDDCFEIVEESLYNLKKLKNEHNQNVQVIRLKMRRECDKLKEEK